MPLDKSTARVQDMFGQIAGRYDFLNRLLSLGIDQSWRRKTVKLVPPQGDRPILDVCTGTADLALAYWRASRGKVPVVGSDFCLPMLEIGREKCHRTGAAPSRFAADGKAALEVSCRVASTGPETDGEPPRLAADGSSAKAADQTIPGTSAHAAQSVQAEHTPTAPTAPFPQGVTLLQADTLHLPFASDTFQIVCVAFGLRNVNDTLAGLQEMTRVCAPGGRVAVLEFSTPTRWPLGALYGWYFRHVLPRVGQALARNSQAAYNYLPQSVGQFPQGEALARLMGEAGLHEVWLRPLTFGVATLYVGKKR